MPREGTIIGGGMALALVLGLGGCMQERPLPAGVDLPAEPGLVFLRAYPDASAPCWAVGESDATRDYLDHTQILIACPEADDTAISDHIAGGGAEVDQVGDWVLLSLPQSP